MASVEDTHLPTSMALGVIVASRKHHGKINEKGAVITLEPGCQAVLLF